MKPQDIEDRLLQIVQELSQVRFDMATDRIEYKHGKARLDALSEAYSTLKNESEDEPLEVYEPDSTEDLFPNEN